MIKKSTFFIFTLLVTAALRGQPVVIPNVWINEIHYNNTGNDTLEGYEIAGDSGTTLGCYMVFYYDGINGQTYRTDTLRGTIPNQQAGIGTVWFPVPQGAIQNTINGAFALVYAPLATNCGVNNADTILQFLSYGGSFTATNGRAQGLATTDITVSETNLTTVGYSLQLEGIGYKYSDFTWQGPIPNTYGLPNTSQVFTPAGPYVEFVLDSASITPVREDADSSDYAIEILNYNANQTQVDINAIPGPGTALNTNFTYSPITATFPANSPFTQTLTIRVIDDHIADGNKSVTFKLANPTNGASIGANNQITLTMLNVDTARATFLFNGIDTVNKTAGIVNVPITLTLPSIDTISVHVSVVAAGTTGIAGADYSFDDTVLTWLPLTKDTFTVPITVINNNLHELWKTVELGISNPTNNGALLDSTFFLTIMENNAGLTLDATLLPPFADTVANTVGVVNIPVTLNLPSTDSIKVQLVVNALGTTGVQNVDYSFNDTTITFPPNIIDTIYVPVTIIQNALIEPWRTVVFHLANPNNGATLGDSIYNLTIVEAPGPLATVQFDIAVDSVVVPDTIQTYNVHFHVNNPGPDTAYWTVVRNDQLSTASEGIGRDYDFVGKEAFSPPGLSDTTFPIYLYPTALVQPTKTAILHFVALSWNCQVIDSADSTFTLYILNYNKLLVSFLGAGYSYPKDTGWVQVGVVLSTFNSEPVTADVTLAPGSAVLGQDFLFTDTTVIFPAYSQDTQRVNIDILSNNIYQPNKQVNLNLSNPTGGAVLGISGYTITIINDDSLAGISEIDFDNSIKTFPNPVINTLNILADFNINQVEITDLLGNLLKVEPNFSQTKTSIDVTSLPAGMYFITAKCGDRMFTKRFIKSD
jgi:hypothetical protein